MPVQLELWGSALARFKEVETDGELHLRCMAAAKGEMRIGRICFVGTRRRRLFSRPVGSNRLRRRAEWLTRGKRAIRSEEATPRGSSAINRSKI